MTQHFTLRLAQSRMLAPSVRHLAFARTDGEAFAFVPGQFLQIHFTHADGKPTKRSYSVATVAARHGEPVRLIEIAVSFVPGGAASDLFAHLDEGGTVEASGPYGRFVLGEGDTNRRYLLIATGTGVTPYRAMLPQLAAQARRRDLEVVLVYGARSEVELLYGEEFEAFAAAQPGFRFIPCFSRGARARPGPHDHLGYVQTALPLLRPDAAGDIVYLCGNPNMVDQSFEVLKQAGLPVPHIRREKYVSSR